MIQTHRVLVILNRDGNTPVNHDEKMSLIWRLLENTAVHHDEVEKPYTWTIEKTGANKYTLTFSSIDTSISEVFLKKAKNSLNQAIQIESSFWIPLLAMPIQDIPFLENFARIETQNGVVCWKQTHTVDKDGTEHHGKVTFDINTDKNGFIEALKRKLIRRAKLFLHKDFNESEIQIKFLRRLNYGCVEYKGLKTPYQNVSFKIIAPKELIELLVYGGLGAKTGSGFGMVLAA